MNLTVLPSSSVSELDANQAAFAAALAAGFRGQVRFGRHDRMLYATDASLYQVEPLGVLVPADVADAAAAVEICQRFGVPMLPRGGGTSLAGQCTNRAVVIDVSARCQHLGGLNTGERTVHAEAGVKIDDINTWLTREKTGLFYAPDPATSAQASVGGCIGNNASGSRSVLYGRTVDSVLEIDAVTASGARVRFGPGAGGRDVIALKLADGVSRIVKANAGLIRERFPKTMRRNAGYALDLILDQVERGVMPQDLDLTKLIVGSEGTLAVVLGAKLKLFPQPKTRGLALMSFTSVDAAIAAVMPILTTKPSAVELVDDVVIEAARGNRECAEYVKAFPEVGGSSPAAVLYVEYHCLGGPEELAERFAALRAAVPDRTKAPMREVTDAAGIGDAWKLRKAGEPLLHGLPGTRKPLTFVEDNAVPVENLSQFVREFRDIVTAAGTKAAFYAHASVGVLHVRPLIDPHNEAELATLRDIAVKVADLAKKLGGVMSGEHGDGRIRGPLLERFYGPEMMNVFRQVKALFDPQGLLNPGNIVSPGPIESITQQTRIDPGSVGAGPGSGLAAGGMRKPHVPELATFYTYEKEEGFGHAVEMCNGAGVCRKSAGGTMCPSYRGTMDERHATRGRGNALRLAITGQLTEGLTASHTPDADALRARFTEPETMATLDLCLSCKACKSECPSNVDIAKLKAEYTAQRYKATGRVPLKALLTGHIRTLNRIGSMTPGLANWGSTLPPVRAAIEAVMKVHPKRTLPAFSRSLYSLWGEELAAANRESRPRVTLFADCFTTYNESHLGMATRRLLEHLGYGVTLPKVGCCGRSMISVGMLAEAADTIDATIEQLREDIENDEVKAILVVEPSCLSAFKDDWLTIRCRSSIELRRKLAAKAMLVEQFIESRWEQHPARPTVPGPEKLDAVLGAGAPVLLHAHCHQKALWGAASSGGILRRVLGSRLTVLDTGCCGMAGSFGYDAEKYDLSMAIANLDNTRGPAGGGVLPHVRKNPTAVILATGTSCRHQIKDGTENTRHALHPVELLEKLLAP